MDYSKLEKIIVRTQEELDSIPLDFKGRIYIKFGTRDNKAIVTNRYYLSVIAWDNSNVEAYENSNVIARDNSNIVAWENSSIVACDNSSVVAWENSNVIAWGNSSVIAFENSNIVAWDNSSVVSWDNSSVVARGNGNILARDNSNVVARGNSNIVVRDNSSVEARENSTVIAWGNAQVVDLLQGAKIKISGNARIVYNPKGINEFMEFYDIKHTKTKAIFYKAVRKIDGKYCADYNNKFIYEIGKEKIEECDKNIRNDCGSGIHISHLDWALDFGKLFDNLAILEVETKIEDIILPENSDGKVRTSRVRVLREVPLEECGLFGKILLKRRVNNGQRI